MIEVSEVPVELEQAQDSATWESITRRKALSSMGAFWGLLTEAALSLKFPESQYFAVARSLHLPGSFASLARLARLLHLARVQSLADSFGLLAC